MVALVQLGIAAPRLGLDEAQQVSRMEMVYPLGTMDVPS